MDWRIALLIPAGYLLGSVSFATLFARLHGLNIHDFGSGNPGATNLSRALGKKWGYICFVCDVLKGFVPMFIAGLLISRPPQIQTLWLWLAVGIAAILGHVYSVFLGFKGGKGVATSLGVVLGLYPYYTFAGLLTFAIWTIAVLLWRYVSLASVLAAMAFPVVLIGLFALIDSWMLGQLWPLLVIAVVMPILVVIRHKTNIQRLWKGTESKVFQKKS